MNEREKKGGRDRRERDREMKERERDRDKRNRKILIDKNQIKRYR